MPTTRTLTAQVIDVRRLRTSRNGNPRFQITLDVATPLPRRVEVVTTRPDASVAYEIDTALEGRHIQAVIEEPRDYLLSFERL